MKEGRRESQAEGNTQGGEKEWNPGKASLAGPEKGRGQVGREGTESLTGMGK